MTSDLDALHRTVLDNPADDTARLVYADALDESGKPWAAARAEFIRLGVERERRPEGWVAREHELLKKWGRGWLPKWSREAARYDYTVRGTVATAGVVNPGDFVFRRGFLWSAKVVSDFDALHPVACARFAQQCLAIHPTEYVTFEIANRDPEVKLSVRTDSQGLWFATLDAGGEGGGTNDYRTRRELCAALPAFLARELPQVEFTFTEIPF